MYVKIMRLLRGAKMPTKGTAQSAGWDLYAYLGSPYLILKPGENVKLHTGIAMAIPSGYFGGIYARSGLAVRNGLRPSTCVSVIDSDYRGEIIVDLYNDSGEAQAIYEGQRVAQIVIQRCEPVQWQQVTHLDETERGSGGFGSTGS